MVLMRESFKENNIFDSIIKVENKWYYRKWKHHTWDDADLFDFVNSKNSNSDVMSDDAKAFLSADIAERYFLNQLN